MASLKPALDLLKQKEDIKNSIYIRIRREKGCVKDDETDKKLEDFYPKILDVMYKVLLGNGSRYFNQEKNKETTVYSSSGTTITGSGTKEAKEEGKLTEGEQELFSNFTSFLCVKTNKDDFIFRVADGDPNSKGVSPPVIISRKDLMDPLDAFDRNTSDSVGDSVTGNGDASSVTGNGDASGKGGGSRKPKRVISRRKSKTKREKRRRSRQRRFKRV